jgi:hypothetical protein
MSAQGKGGLSAERQQIRENLKRLTRDFYRAFCEEFERYANAKRDMGPETFMLFNLELAFRERHQTRKVRELFAKHGPRTPRMESRYRRARLARLYGRAGKPPKLRFARWAARENKARIEAGYHLDDLLGSGTADVENMHHYVKEMLKQKVHRDSADSSFEDIIEEGGNFLKIS